MASSEASVFVYLLTIVGFFQPQMTMSDVCEPPLRNQSMAWPLRRACAGKPTRRTTSRCNVLELTGKTRPVLVSQPCHACSRSMATRSRTAHRKVLP